MARWSSQWFLVFAAAAAPSLATAAEASLALGLPHNPGEAVRLTRHKLRARELLRKVGIPVPQFWKFSTEEDPRIAARHVGYPCVLKPLFLSASRGVIRANDGESFALAFERVKRLLADPEILKKGGEAAGWILVESYIQGDEVAVEGLLVGGELKVLAIFDKPDPLEGPFFEETIYVTPSRFSEERQRHIIEMTARTAFAVGLREGPLHAELRLNEEGIWPLEVAARSVGGLCSRALRFGAGMSLEELIIRHALGMDLESLERERRAAAGENPEESFQNLIRLGLIQSDYEVDDRRTKVKLTRDGRAKINAELESHYELAQFAMRFVRACRAPKATIDASTDKS